MSKTIVPQTPLEQLPIPQLKVPFEGIKHYDENGIEYWLAREYMPTLEYASWQFFKPVIFRAMEACKNSGQNPDVHFMRTHDIGSNRQRKVDDFKLSRLAGYLIAMNGDPKKAIIAEAQIYFASQTRRQELADEQAKLNGVKDINAYRLKGFTENKAVARVGSKREQKKLNTELYVTHETHTPDYGRIGGVQNQELFDMGKREIIAYLGLLPSQADGYRDQLGEYALEALRLSSSLITKRMKQIGRSLTTDEQVEIVHEVCKIIAPTMEQMANFVGEDYISGAPLDENGNALINRNVPLIGDGNETF